MIRCLSFLSSIALVLVLGGCTQRTVTTTDSRVTFAGAQMGDYEKIQEKFGAKCEMKDGVPVASNGKSNLQLNTLKLNNFQTKSFQGSGSGTSVNVDKTFATSRFNRTPEIKTTAAKEGRKEFSTRAASETGAVFPTQNAAEAEASFSQSSKQAREGDREFFAAKRSAQENQSRATPARADVVLDRASGRLKENSSTLTEQQVRDILHPELSAKN